MVALHDGGDGAQAIWPLRGGRRQHGTLAAIPFFLSYQIIGSFVFTSLFLAVIIENYALLGNGKPIQITAEQVDGFTKAWALYDRTGAEEVPLYAAPDIILGCRRRWG